MSLYEPNEPPKKYNIFQYYVKIFIKGGGGWITKIIASNKYRAIIIAAEKCAEGEINTCGIKLVGDEIPIDRRLRKKKFKFRYINYIDDVDIKEFDKDKGE